MKAAALVMNYQEKCFRTALSMRNYMRMKKTGKAFGRKSFLLLSLLAIGSCWGQSSSTDRYDEAWQEVLNSQEWKDELEDEVSVTTSSEQYLFAGNDSQALEINDAIKIGSSSNFDSKYEVLVKRAYLKIIAEAEKADTRLEREYILRNAAALKKGQKRSPQFEQRLELINKRYHAHRKMLDGLKSWNINSEYGTNDLDFFMAENQGAVQEMLQKGKKEVAITKYLIYKLADLYHFEG